MKIALIGFMGSGKTTVGEALANMLGFEFVEMDKVVLEKTNFRDMQELFSKNGEIYLREWEIALAKEWQEKEKTVISTGGGVVMNNIIPEYLKKNNGHVIFLHASFQTLEQRVIKDKTPRPLFGNVRDAYRLYHFRLPLYKKYADMTIRTKGKDAVKIAKEIVLKLYKNEPADLKDKSLLKEVVEQIMNIRAL
ncbi:shikimate kinase [Candidatus Roizmanbacteria bacterium]|nr:MAG: shikimate kinase [Candidatus Roizmanbacteria bacterium]